MEALLKWNIHITHVEVNLLDNEGHLIFDTNHLIMCEISGHGLDAPGEELTTKHTKYTKKKITEGLLNC